MCTHPGVFTNQQLRAEGKQSDPKKGPVDPKPPRADSGKPKDRTVEEVERREDGRVLMDGYKDDLT